MASALAPEAVVYIEYDKKASLVVNFIGHTLSQTQVLTAMFISCLFSVPNFEFPRMPFSQVIANSMNASQSQQSWCDKCSKYQPHVCIQHVCLDIRVCLWQMY